MATGAQVGALDGVDAGRTKRTLGRAPQIELPTGNEVCVEESCDLGPDLVAARPDRGSDDCRFRARAKRSDPRGDYTFRKAAPACVQQGERARAIASHDGD